MSNPSNQRSIWDYYAQSPEYLIRDHRKWLYSFPSSWINNESNVKRYDKGMGDNSRANGWAWEAAQKIDINDSIKGSPWTDTRKVEDHDYSTRDVQISNKESDNADSDDNVRGLDGSSTPVGYEKLSTGSGDNSRGYIIAITDSSDPNYIFALYKRKDRDQFVKELLDANKDLFQPMVSNDCSYGNNRYNYGYCNLDKACGQGPRTTDGNDNVRNNCNAGADQWCRDEDFARVVKENNDYGNAGTKEPKCFEPLKEGKLNGQLGDRCKKNDKINTNFCNWVRRDVGDLNIKNDLNNWLYNTCNQNNNHTEPFCKELLKESVFDERIRNTCIRDNNGNNIGSAFCRDIRKDIGNDGIKRELNAHLYKNYCDTDNNLNKSECDDFRNTCKNITNLAKNEEPFNCNSGIKELNDNNRFEMVRAIDFTKDPPSGFTKDNLLREFNKSGSNSVSDSLCGLAINSQTPICQDYLNNNFSALVKTTPENPILIMYFDNLELKNKRGMDASNSSMITFRSNEFTKATDNPPNAPILVGVTNTNKIQLPSKWGAKLYTYITPSTTGDYLFKANADDLVKVYLNNNLIINNWDGTKSDSSTSISLDPNKGPYLLYVEYGDGGGAGWLKIEYAFKTASPVYEFLRVLPNNIPVSGVSPLTGTGVESNRLYMSRFSPYNLVTDAKRRQSIKYCSTNNRFATDVNCTGNLANNYKSINSLYTGIDGTATGDPEFVKSMINYCATGNKFTTDQFCLGDVNLENDYINGVLKNPKLYDPNNNSIGTAIDTFCKAEINNTYSTTNKEWCKNNDNTNNRNHTNINGQTLHPEYAKILRNTRLKYNQDAIKKSITTGGALTKDVMDYIDIDYLDVQRNTTAGVFPDNNIVTPDVISFCQNSDPSLQTDLCKTVYNNSKYKTGTDIIASRAAIDDKTNCIDNNAFMGKSSSTEFNASCTAKRDAPATYARYLPLAINYCGTGDNIVSPECTTYYNNVQTNINNAMANVYTNGGRSSFTNKESFEGGNCDGQDDVIYDNHDNQDDVTCDNNTYDYTFLFILFICFALVLCCLASYSKCKKNKHTKYHSQNAFQPQFQPQFQSQSL